MILEIADIRITPGRQAEFDEAIERGLRTVIAQAAGMSTGAVFASFADKSELFDEILTADYEVIYGQMVQAARSATTVDAALLGLFGVAYSFHLEQLPLLRASIAVSWTRNEAAERRSRTDLKHIFRLIGEVTQRGIDQGVVIRGGGGGFVRDEPAEESAL